MMMSDLAQRGGGLSIPVQEEIAHRCSRLASQWRRWATLLLLLCSSGVFAQTMTFTGASPSTFSAAGQVITFSVQFGGSNAVTGSINLQSMNLTPVSALNCPGLPLPPNQTVTCTFTYTTKAADVGNPLNQYGSWIAAPPQGSPTRSGATSNQQQVPYVAAVVPTLSINNVSLAEGNAGTTNFNFTVSLSAPAPAGGVSFDIATANGTATAGTDYVARSLTGQTIPSGSSSYTFTVQVNGDALNEANETFFVNVTNLSGATAGDSQGQGTIVNDDVTPPTVTSISPTSGPVAGGTTVVITGTNLAGATAVTFGGTAAVGYTVNSNTQITATAPAGSGTVDVRVTTPGGTSATSAADQYTYIAAPTVTALSPNNGPTSGGTTVVITGTNLAGASAVVFGATAATGYTVNSSTQITATAPAGSGTVNVRVTTGGGTSATSAANQYTYVAPPVANNVSATVAYNSSSNPITLNITGGAPTSVAVGTQAAHGTATASGTSITYTPAAGYFGADSFTYTATNSAGTSAPATVSLSVAIPSAPTASDKSGVAVPYNSSGTAIDLSGSISGVHTSIALGSAPAHGTVSVAGDVVTYTPTTGYAGADSFTYTATGPGGTSAPATVSLTVAAPTITISPTSLPNAQAGAAYSQTLTASGGTATYSYAVTAGSLPAGLVLSAGGALSGTPTATGTFNFTVTVTDAMNFTGSRAYSLTVGAPTLTMTPAPGTLSMPYGQATTINFVAGAGTAPYSFSLTAGSLPVGVSLSSTGVLSGTPTVPGNYNLSVRATDSSTGAGPFTITQSYTIAVAVPSIAIDPATLPDGVVGTSYSQTFSASGGVAPYSFSLQAGAMPIGMSLSSSGVLSGVPRSDGNFSLTLRATDANGQNASRVYTFSIAPPTLVISPATLPGGTSGVAYSQSLSTSGGIAPYTYSIVSGSLPVGVSFSSSGTLSGTPSVAGSYTFTIRSTDDAGYHADIAYTLAIGGASQTITFAAQPAQVFVANGTFALNPPATASSGLAVSYSSQTASVCSISGTTVTMLAAGSCVIAADQAGDASYLAAAQVTQTIAIGKATQTITGFAANPAAPVYASGATFAVSATGGASGNPVVFASTTPSVCTVSGSTVTMLAAGACSLTANQAGDANYNAAPQVALNVTIGAATPTLSWIGNQHKTVGEAAFDLPNPTSNSSGAFTFTSNNPAVATISGRTVTIVGAGQATLVATQAAAGNYTVGTVSLVLTVDDRPDPTTDAEVVGGLQAQLDAAVRFATAQQANIHDRLRQLRSTGGNASSNNLSLSLTGDNGPGLSLNADQVAGASTLPKGWGVWTAGVVSLGDRDARNASQGFDWRSDGVTVGIDRLFGDQVVLGVAAGMGWNTTDFDRSVSELDAKQRSVSLYGLWHSGKHVFADALLGMGSLEFDIDRWSEVAGKTATARREGGQTFGSLTVGYEQGGERATWTGYGRYDMTRMRLDAYRENGLGIYDLHYASQDVENDTLALGVENRYAFKRASSSWRPYWKLEYRQAVQNQGDAAINYVVAPRSSDYLLGLRSYNDDVLSLGGGLDVDFSSGWALSFLFLREQAKDTTANSFGLRVSYGSAAGAAGVQYLPARAGSLDRPVTGP